MKIYSEKTNKEYKTVEDCLKAEKEFDEALEAEKAKKQKLSEEKKARAVEVEEAWKAVREANKKYVDLKNKFINDYGAFHMTLKDKDDNLVESLWESFFRF
jgi:hypothetical protein